MQKKLVANILMASAIIGGSALPCFAGMETDDIATFPIKLVGSGISTVLGAPLGATKGSVEGSIKTTKYAAKTMGNEDGTVHLIVGSVVAGPFGAVGGAAYGCVTGLIHGAKTGYNHPFSKESFTFKDE
jgi:hypothetical protein